MKQVDYYYLIPKLQDEHGLTHGYRSFVSKRFGHEEFDQFSMGRTIKYDSYREGPPRLYEVPRFDSSIFPLMLLSEHVKEFFSYLKLPEHEFKPTNLEHYKLFSDASYYRLQLKENSLLEYLDWNNTDFFYTLKSNSNSLEATMDIQSQITNKEDIENEKIKLKEALNVKVVHIHPKSFPQAELHDIVTYHYPYVLGKIIMVADYVKTAFEKYFPNQVDFILADKLDILVDQQQYQERRQYVESLDIHVSQLNYEVEEEFLFYQSKMNRLKDSETPETIHIPYEDEFTDKSSALGLVFPDSFKDLYRQQPSLEYFEWLPIKEMYIEGNYESSNPNSYRSVIFAEDGSGEGLGLLLEPASDYQLGEDWYYFSHEDGQVFKVKDINEYIRQ